MITFVYFDLGGVVIDDFSGNNKWSALKHELGINLTNDGAFELLWNEYQARINLDVPVDDLLPIISEHLDLKLDPTYSLLNGFVKRFDANPELWPVIRQIMKHARIGLVTNMYPGMYAAILNRHILPPDVTWEIIIDSSVEKLQKPDAAIFNLAQARAAVVPKEILFIDNSKEHVLAAASQGWLTFLYDSSDHKKSVHELQTFIANTCEW